MGVKQDPIDLKLAQLVNAQPSEVRRQMQFVRESEGVYRLNKRRVLMSIHEDSIIIRVGGGYLTLEQYLQLH